MREMKTVYLSKYALTNGIKEYQAEIEGLYAIVSDRSGGYVGFRTFALGREAHLTRDAALEKAKKMREKKIASLEKQIKKLKAMTF
jgi:hypothetical protein